MNQSTSTSAKRQVAAEAWCFIILCECQWSPLVFDRRALSAQPTDLIKALVNQWLGTATWSLMERSTASACIPHNKVLEELWKSTEFRAQTGSSLEEVFVCSWENHVSVFTVCASIWAENILSHKGLNTYWASAEKGYFMLNVSLSVLNLSLHVHKLGCVHLKYL